MCVLFVSVKDKAEVLKQVEELTSDKDDLTAEVSFSKQAHKVDFVCVMYQQRHVCI